MSGLCQLPNEFSQTKKDLAAVAHQKWQNQDHPASTWNPLRTSPGRLENDEDCRSNNFRAKSNKQNAWKPDRHCFLYGYLPSWGIFKFITGGSEARIIQQEKRLKEQSNIKHRQQSLRRFIHKITRHEERRCEKHPRPPIREISSPIRYILQQVPSQQLRSNNIQEQCKRARRTSWSQLEQIDSKPIECVHRKSEYTEPADVE